MTYNGNSTPLNLQVSRTMTLQAQIPGDEIFKGTATYFPPSMGLFRPWKMATSTQSAGK